MAAAQVAQTVVGKISVFHRSCRSRIEDTS